MGTFLDYLLIPIIFSIRAAITTLLLIKTIFSPSTIAGIFRFVDQSFDSLHEQCAEWFFFILWACMFSCVGRWIGSFLWTIFCVLFCGPLALWAFYKHCNNFGPSHTHRSLSQILRSPVPPQEFYYANNSDTRLNEYTWANPVARKIMRSKRYISTQDRRLRRHEHREHREFVSQFKLGRLKQPQYKCPHNKITPLAQRHHIYSMYSTPHAGTMGFGNTEASDEMARTLYFAINAFSIPEIVWLALPKKPPDGIITEALVCTSIASIFAAIVTRAYLFGS